MKTIVIGDIHGWLDPIVELLELASWRVGKSPYRRVFLGDYIDRGPQTKQLIDWLIANRRDDDVYLMGNHEDMFLHNFDWYMKGKDAHDRAAMVQCFWTNGGTTTMQSYGWTPFHEEVSFPNSHVEFFRKLKVCHEDERRFYVHAGINPGFPLIHQRTRDCLWIRDDFLRCKFKFEKYIVHGHTPQFTGKPQVLENRTNMDTGGCFGGCFSAAIFDDSQDEPLEYVTVNGK